MATSLVQVRVDEELKAQATKIYDNLGLDLSSAVRIFLKRSVMENGIPFTMTLSNEDTTLAAALSAKKALQASAKENGIADMSLEEINAEIAAYRKERSKRK